MTDSTHDGPSRRQVLKAAAASALAGVVLPQVHAAEDNTVRVALIGCGGRGTGAAENAMNVARYGPVKLVAMADVFEDRLKASYDQLQNTKVAKHVEVPADRKFIGFDAYKHAMDCLKPGDVAIFTTPLAFRWVHFGYAIEKGLNVFMEKPLLADGPTAKKMFKLAEESEKKNMKVGVGLMCRHCVVRQELFKKIKDGAIGDITLLRAYRVKGPEATQYSYKKDVQFPPKKENGKEVVTPELAYQIRRFHSFLWASGGSYNDFLIHNIDECCWMKDAWPVEARAIGGRHYRTGNRGEYVDQNFDHYTVEYTFADGAKLMLESRNIPGCWQAFASYAHGTKGSAIISSESHTPAHSRIFSGQKMPIGRVPRRNEPDVTWKWEGGEREPDPYQLEWDDLITAIRQDKPYNEVKRGTEASLISSMGRMAAHTGQVVTRDQILNDGQVFATDVDKLTSMDSPAPVQADKDGKYPVPEPGRKRMREY
ncbi:MAG TPA: Gfo/Idh/MocA family oxidoreductase [Gemmataceae bacterium]